MNVCEKRTAILFACVALLAMGTVGSTGSEAVERAAVLNCTTCTPSSGSVGYTWFALTGSTSFSCIIGQQTITHSYSTAQAGILSDGRLSIIRFNSSGTTQEMTVSSDASCTLRFP
jgi:hypothetical protein